jgi:hypothetical protein
MSQASSAGYLLVVSSTWIGDAVVSSEMVLELTVVPAGNRNKIVAGVIGAVGHVGPPSGVSRLSCLPQLAHAHLCTSIAEGSVSCRPLLRAFSRPIVFGSFQVIAVFLALMGFMVVKNKGKAKAFVKSFMSFEGPAGLLVAPSKAHLLSAECAVSCAGIIVLELCLEIWVRIGDAIVVYSCLVMLTHLW